MIVVVVVALSIDPQFDTSLSNVTVIRGDTATLPCAIDSLGKFKVDSRQSFSLISHGVIAYSRESVCRRRFK